MHLEGSVACLPPTAVRPPIFLLGRHRFLPLSGVMTLYPHAPRSSFLYFLTYPRLPFFFFGPDRLEKPPRAWMLMGRLSS